MSKVIFAAFVAALAGAGCSSSNNSSDGGGTTGSDTTPGVVIGPPDHHCVSADGGLTVQTIGVCNVADPSLEPSNTASCSVSFNDSSGADGGASTDSGDTMYGAAGDDDDCKYYISWTATPIQENTDTFFFVTATRLADMKPATCAGIRPDVSLNINTGAVPPPNPSTEIAPGVYKVGPIKFVAPGKWTVRFHLFEECSDSTDDSPHGHAAFFVQVP